VTPGDLTPFDWGVVVTSVIGHFGLHLAAFNRINATGLSSRIVKRVSLGLIFSALLVPLWAARTFATTAGVVPLDGNAHDSLAGWQAFPLGWIVYGCICLASTLILGIPWLLARPIFGIGHVRADRQVEVVRLDRLMDPPATLSGRSHWWAKIPGNQMLELAVERIDLPIIGLPTGLDGYRIAQLSDLHFTGHVSPAWTTEAVSRMNDWRPDLVALTGDIIDSPECIDWLAEALGHAEARDGRYFILGNHDVRKVSPEQVREAMRTLGWTDVGGRAVPVLLRREQDTVGSAGVATLILGNEAPWGPAPQLDQQAPIEGSEPHFRLLLSHSPDQFGWARRHGVQLMLAGHTHGGQGRLPLIGPVISPSWHGSRYASGDFYREPTTLHVSRGLSGTHLMRVRCRPELSLLTLRRASV